MKWFWETARQPNSQNCFGKQGNSKGTKQPKWFWKTAKQQGHQTAKKIWKTGEQQGHQTAKIVLENRETAKGTKQPRFFSCFESGRVDSTNSTGWRKGNRKFHLCRHSPLHIESQGTKHFYLLKLDFSIWRPLFANLILHCCFKEAKIK